jgi:tRNA threonylcarbamoyladenosine biosynthesis protein TsaE
MSEMTVNCPSETCSFELGRLLGGSLEPGDVVALWGELGAGKTFITRGIARGLGVPWEVPVTSPTYTFINEYDGRLHLYHLDLYRLTHPDDLETLPWREALFGTSVAVIEWPDRLGDYLPDERWDIRLTVTGDESRAITLIAYGENRRTRLDECAREIQQVFGIGTVTAAD